MITMPTATKVNKQGKDSTDTICSEFAQRRIYLFDEVNKDSALSIISQINYLNENGSGDITLFINSPGGSVADGLAIYDAILRSKCDVSTVCTGMAASMGAFLLAAGTKGKRFVTPMSEVMIHQPLSGMQGQASDLEIAANHVIRIKKKLNLVLAEKTGRSYDEIARDTDRDNWLSAEEAISYGIADGMYK